MAKSWLIIATLILLSSGCSQKNGEQTYPVPVAEAYVALTRLDLAKEKDPALPAGRVETDLVGLKSVTWRFVAGNIETARIVATVSPRGEKETAVAIDVDMSRAPSGGAIADQTSKLAKPLLAALVAEKLAASLEDRDYDRERVNTLAKAWGYGGPGQMVELYSQRGEMLADAGRIAAQAAAAERNETGDISDTDPYQKVLEQERMQDRRNKPKMSYAEEQAWRADNRPR